MGIIMKLNIPHMSMVDEDISKMQQLPADEKAGRKSMLLRSIGVNPTEAGPYLDYIHEVQRLNGLPRCNDLPDSVHDQIQSDLFTRRFFMAICA